VVRRSANILEGEAMGLNAAIDFVESKGLRQVTFEMDASTIVSAVKKRCYPRNYWGRIARRCGEFLNRNHRSGISWVRRTGNIAAHMLANWASNEPDRDWNYETPLCIQTYIQNDIDLL
jgi:ribonuclease HI